LKAQGISRDTLHCRSRVQPYAAQYALGCSTFVLLLQGYSELIAEAFIEFPFEALFDSPSSTAVFLSGNWDTPSFIFA
jgi:yeast amino acid transporter